MGADPSTQTIREMADRVATMKKVWAGEKLTDSVRRSAPRRCNPAAPAAGRHRRAQDTAQCRRVGRGTRRHHPGPRRRQTERALRRGTAAWAEAGKPAPHLATSFWFALGDPEESCAQMHRHLRHYMNWIPAEIVDAMAPTHRLRRHRGASGRRTAPFAAIGTTEVHLIPTSSDLDQLRRAADVAAEFFLREGRIGVMSFGDYQIEIYFQGLTGVLPSLPLRSFLELESGRSRRCRRRCGPMSPVARAMS